jgi:opacity protein-like surface antigen
MKPLLLALSAIGMATAAQANVIMYQGTFAPEVPGATGNGTLTLAYDDVGRTLAIEATWAGLSGNTSNAHIHCCTTAPRAGTAGVALAQAGLLPGFPLGLQEGSYSRVIDLTLANQYSGAFVTASGGTAALAEQRLMANLASGNAYFNIHSTTFPGGEIRAFVSAVPEPGTMALVLMAAGVAVVSARQRKGA